MSINPLHDFVVKRGEFGLRDVGQSRADIYDDALREEVGIVVLEIRQIVRRARIDGRFLFAATLGHRRGRRWIRAAHLCDVRATAKVEGVFEIANYFFAMIAW